MLQKIAHITLLVDDYDKAIEFYTKKLNFIQVEDTKLSDVKRWVLVKPQGDSCCLLLAKASNAEQRRMIGNQSGGRVFLFLYTDDFEEDYLNLIRNGITIVRKPVLEEYGKVAVFKDIYGNLWDLIQPENH